MADTQTPRDTYAYNTGYNQPYDIELITLRHYDSPTPYDQSQSDTKPQSPGQQLPNYGQQPPSFNQQQKPYGDQTSIAEQHPLILYQQSQNKHMHMKTYINDPRRSSQMRAAVCACFFCFLPAGIVAIIYAKKAVDAYIEYTYEQGNHYYNISRCWILLSWLAGILIGFVLIIHFA